MIYSKIIYFYGGKGKFEAPPDCSLALRAEFTPDSVQGVINSAKIKPAVVACKVITLIPVLSFWLSQIYFETLAATFLCY